MGASNSKMPPDVDLLPPRFERRPVPLDRVAIDPQQYLFGREVRILEHIRGMARHGLFLPSTCSGIMQKLDRLFSGFFAKPDSLMFQAALRPDFDEKLRIAVFAEAGKTHSAGQEQPFGLSLNYTDSESNPAWQAGARLGSDGSMRGQASYFDCVSGVGAYALLPAEYFLYRKYNQGQGGAPAAVGGTSALPAVQVGNGLSGPPVRYTHASHASYGATDGLGVAVSPREVSQVPADVTDGARPAAAGGLGSLAGQPVVPEVGYRWVNPQQTFSAGAHIGVVPPFPFKLWGVTRQGRDVDGSTMTAGVSISSDDTRLHATADKLAARLGSACSANLTSIFSGPEAVSNPFIIDASVSVAQEPLYEVSLAYDGHRREAVAGYVHTMTVRRNVYNPLEARHVKGIYQYVDVGIEFRRKLLPPFTSTIAAAASWQMNRHVMLRTRLGTRDVSASVALKTWTDPAVALCATGSYDRLRNKGALGLFLSLEKGGAVEYSKAVAGQQAVTPNRALEARPALSARVTSEVDRQPFLDPPGTLGRGASGAGSVSQRASLGGTGSSPANRFL